MEDLTGNIFGLLTVIGPASKANKQRGRRWECRCLCGKLTSVQGYNLKRGNTKSCGCLVGEKMRGKCNPRFKGYEEISGSKLYEYKKNAKLRGLNFEVTIQDLWEQFLAQNRKCALTGVELTFQKTILDRASTASLDRVDSTLGYTKGNIQWLHKDVNYMKSDLPQEVFIQICKQVASQHEGKP